jgi:hypothetical protein
MIYIIPFLIISFSTLSIDSINAQSQHLIDSLVSTNDNKVIVFKTNCNGCVVLKEPCQDYVENGNPWSLYVVWKNKKGFFMKKFNNCGSSNVLNFKIWKTDPFGILNLNANKIDTTELKYPLTFNLKDTTWYETDINHYKFYEISFPSYDLRNVLIKDYAFRKVKSDDDLLIPNEVEFKRNEKRYAYNNKSAVKELLDSLLSIIDKKQKKLKIKQE